MRRLKLFRKKKDTSPLTHRIYQPPESKIYNSNAAIVASPGFGFSFKINPIIDTANTVDKNGESKP